MDDAECPCGGGPYATCCGPAHERTAWPETAEALMRSRYSAFALGLDDYLWRTWHPRTRPEWIDLDTRTWTGLTVLDVVDGGKYASEGVVEFEAHWRLGKRRGFQRERSAFSRRAGRWFYVDAV